MDTFNLLIQGVKSCGILLNYYSKFIFPFIFLKLLLFKRWCPFFLHLKTYFPMSLPSLLAIAFWDIASTIFSKPSFNLIFIVFFYHGFNFQGFFLFLKSYLFKNYAIKVFKIFLLLFFIPFMSPECFFSLYCSFPGNGICWHTGKTWMFFSWVEANNLKTGIILWALDAKRSCCLSTSHGRVLLESLWPALARRLLQKVFSLLCGQWGLAFSDLGLCAALNVHVNSYSTPLI